MAPQIAFVLDPQTLLFSVGMLGLLMAVIFLSFARAVPEYRAGLVAWSKAMAATGAAFTLYFFRGEAPLLVTFVLANALVFGPPYWGHEAHARLLNVAPRRKWTLGLVAFGMSGVMVSFFRGTPYPIAFFTIALALSALLGMTTCMLWRSLRKRRTRAKAVAMVVYGTLSAGFALRAMLGLMRGVQHFAPQAQSPAQLFTLLPGLILIVVCSICILSMVHEHHIDQAKARQDELEDFARQLAQASAMKSQFLANMSHEIRTPLNAILGFAQLLQHRTYDEQQRHFVSMILTAGRTLLHLVNDVLDLSRIESGRLQVEHRPFLLQEVLTNVIEMLDPAAQAKGLQLVLQPLPQGLPPLAGDALRLEQVLYNLVGNAIKFTHTGGVSIEIEKLREEQHRVELQLTVRDSGIGIAADKVDHIFDAFTQADSSTSRRYGGTGLGLAICKQWATLMGGRIGVRSQPGVGSEFWLQLAFDVSDEPAVDTCAKAPAAASFGPRLDGIRVLVVDDAPFNLDVAQRLLEFEGAHCLTASDGREALQRLHDKPDAVDVVLMDVQMPGLDGLEVVRRMRAEQALAGVPVIALTAGALPSQREEALGAGMDDFLAKPLEQDALVETILRWAMPQRPCRESAPAMVLAAQAQKASFPVVAGIDHQRAQRRFLGDRALFLRLLQGMRDDFAQVVHTVRSEVQQGALAQAAMRVHKLRGLAATLSADALAAAAAELENALRLPQPAALEPLLQALEDALNLVIAAVPAPVDTRPADAARGTPARPASPGDVAALTAAVDSNDTSAMDHFETLRDLLADRHGAEAVDRLDQALQGFRFQEAGTLLRSWGYHADREEHLPA